MSSYSPPLSSAVFFDDTSSSYTPPASNAVFFDDTSTAITLPVATITFAGIAPTIFQTRNQIIELPVATLTFAGVAPVIAQSTNSARVGYPHRSLLGGIGAEGLLGHRMVIGGLSQEGVRAGHRTVIGGMGKEGLEAIVVSPRIITLTTYASLAFAGIAPVIRQLDGGSGHVLLYVPFTGNVSTDRGPQALGDGTNVGATFSTDRFPLSGDTIQTLEWYSTGLGRPLSTNGFTFECFMVLDSSTAVTDPGLDFNYSVYNSADILQERFFIHAYSNAGAIQLDLAGFGVEAQSATGVLTGSRQHVAIVQQASSSDVDVYVNGVRIFNYVPGGTPPVGSKGLVHIGRDSGAAGEPISAYIDDVRLCDIAIYSGASFTPPTVLAAS